MPHKDDFTEFTPDRYPPFPTDLPTVTLDTLSLRLLERQDPTEQARAVHAFKTRGFVYLDLAGTDHGATLLTGATHIAQAAERTFRLPLAEKLAYKPGPRDLFGFKSQGATNADKSGTPDTAEFFNVSKDDMLAPCPRRPWPQHILDDLPLFRAYILAAHATGLLILDLLARHLGIDPAEIHARHRLADPAGDHIRMTRGPPRQSAEMPEVQTPSHTDFGTITLLMNWLGGLQVWSESSRSAGPLEPDTPGEWLWVKPKPGCAIVNLGDAAVKFTNGVLCSGRHRVIPAPGEQGKWPRYSVVYFVRPTDDSRLKTLKGSGVPPAGDEEEEGVRAQDWIYQQALGLGSRHLVDK